MDKIIKADKGIVIGARKKESRTPFRKFLAGGFSLLLRILCDVGLRDTQCGFKLFSRKGNWLWLGGG